MNTSSISQIHAQEDSSFLERIQQDGGMSIRDVVLAAPTRFLSASIAEASLPKRFASRIESMGIRTMGDLLNLKEEAIRGRNLGERTVAATTDALAKFFVRKINQRNVDTQSLRDQLKDYTTDLMAREARIWEMRMGLNKERSTLEEAGSKYGLTRERVRQIESALFAQFSRRYPIISSIKENVVDGMPLSQLSEKIPEIKVEDTLPISAVLENLEPKYYLIGDEDPIISSSAKTEFEANVRKALYFVEEVFRGSETLLTLENLLEAMQARKFDEAMIQMALVKVEKEGTWIDDFLLSPNTENVNYAIGFLQASPRPLHLEELSEEIFALVKVSVSAESLRSSLSLVPSVRSFGYGTVGFKRHTFLTPEEVSKVVRAAEYIIEKGKDGYQWSAKDLTLLILARYPEIKLTHHQLNVILRDSNKLSYLGRLTWSLKGEVEERKHYRQIFVEVLNKAGKPLPEDILIERVRRQRGIHLNVHLRHESEIMEVLPKVWGLTRRDAPFNKSQVKKLTEIFDASFGKDLTQDDLEKAGINTHGIKISEILKVVEVNS